MKIYRNFFVKTFVDKLTYFYLKYILDFKDFKFKKTRDQMKGSDEGKCCLKSLEVNILTIRFCKIRILFR